MANSWEYMNSKLCESFKTVDSFDVRFVEIFNSAFHLVFLIRINSY